MARTRTLAELRTEVRQRADMENSSHVGETELTRYINQSAARLYGRLVEKYEGDFIAGASLSTVAGTETYTINAAFYKLAAIPPVATVNGAQRRLTRWNPNDYARLSDTAYRGSPVYYRLTVSDKISILPIPDAVYTILVPYIPAFTAMSGDSDTFDGRNGWEEWVVIDAAIKCLMKEEGNVQGLVSEREMLWADITSQHATKDAASPDRVKDTEREEWWDVPTART